MKLTPNTLDKLLRLAVPERVEVVDKPTLDAVRAVLLDEIIEDSERSALYHERVHDDAIKAKGKL